MVRSNRQKRRHPRKQQLQRRPRRRRNAPARPPPVNVDPWFHVTLSYEDKQDGKLNCFTVDAIYKALDNQLDMSRAGKYFVLQVHRIRIWNISGGPIFFEPCQLVEKHACGGVTLPLTSIEEYAGRNSWARVQYSWPKFQSKVLQDDNSNSSVVFLRKGRVNDIFVIHLSVSFKISTPNSFVTRSVSIRNPAPSRPWASTSATTDPDLQEFEDLSLQQESSEQPTEVRRVLRSSARSRKLL